MANKIKGLTVEVNGDTTRLKTALNQAEDVVKRYDKQLKTLNKALNEDPTNSDNISKKQEVLKKLVEETTIEIEKYRDIQNQLDAKGVSHSSAEWIDLENRIISAESSLVTYRKQMSSLSTETILFKQQMDSISETTGKLASKLAPLSASATMALKTMAEQAISYESSIANIKKVVTDLTDETVSDLKEIATTTGTAFSEISDYASMAGTLGIAEKDISAFAKAMTDLNTATGGAIAGEDGAKSVARFLNLVDVGTEQVGNFGSALTGVADKFATTADEVLETASAMAGLASVFNVDQYDLIGISAVLQSLGVSANVSASSLTKTFQTIELAVDGAGDELKLFANTAGYSADEFVSKWKSEPMQVLLDFADGLQGQVFTEINQAIQTNSDKLAQYAEVLGMTKEQFTNAFNEDGAGIVSQYADALGDLSEEETSAISILDELGLSGVRYSQTLLKIAGNGQEVKDAIADANIEWQKNTALTNKANTVYDTTERKLEGAKERLKQIGASLGDSLLPLIEDGCDALEDFANWFSNLSDGSKKTIVAITGFTAVLSPMLKGVSNITGGVSSAIGAFDKFKSKLSELGKATQLASGASGIGGFITSLGGLSTALPLVGVGIATLVAGTALVASAMEDYKNSITYKNKEIMDSIDETMEKASEQYSQQVYAIEKTTISAQQQASNINALVDIWNAETNAKKDNTETQEQLEDAISILNDTLGTTTYYFDAETGKIMSQDGQVQNLTESIKQLNEAKIKQAWLDNYMEAYDEVLSKEQELLQNRDTAVADYGNKIVEMQQTDKALYDAYNNYINATEENKSKYLDEYNKKSQEACVQANALLTSLISSKQTAIDAESAYESVVAQSENMKNNMTAINEAEGESVNNLMAIAGLGLNLDPAKNDAEEIEQKISNTKALIEAQTQLGLDTTQAREELALYNEQLILAQQASTETANLQKINTDEANLYRTTGAQTTDLGIAENRNLTSDSVLEHDKLNTDQSSEYTLAKADETGAQVVETGKSYTDTFLNEMINKMIEKQPAICNSTATGYKNGVDEALAYVGQANFDKEATLTYHIKYSQVGQAWSGLPSNYGGSGGLSRSGSLSQSGGITLNNTFNVSSNGVTRNDVNGWAVQIADVVSEILGGRIHV